MNEKGNQMAKKKNQIAKDQSTRKPTRAMLTNLAARLGIAEGKTKDELYKLITRAMRRPDPAKFLERLVEARNSAASGGSGLSHAGQAPGTSPAIVTQKRRDGYKVESGGATDKHPPAIKVQCPSCNREWPETSNQAELIQSAGQCAICEKRDAQAAARDGDKVEPPGTYTSLASAVSSPTLPPVSSEPGTITITVPVGSLLGSGYTVSKGAVAKRLRERRLQHHQGVALGRLFVGMIRDETTGKSGKRVSSKEDAVCCLLDLIANAIAESEHSNAVE